MDGHFTVEKPALSAGLCIGDYGVKGETLWSNLKVETTPLPQTRDVKPFDASGQSPPADPPGLPEAVEFGNGIEGCGAPMLSCPIEDR